jgi:hypothetical protein
MIEKRKENCQFCVKFDVQFSRIFRLSLIFCAPYVIISGNAQNLIFTAVNLARMGMDAETTTYYNFLKSGVSVNIHICKRIKQ